MVYYTYCTLVKTRSQAWIVRQMAEGIEEAA